MDRAWAFAAEGETEGLGGSRSAAMSLGPCPGDRGPGYEGGGVVGAAAFDVPGYVPGGAIPMCPALCQLAALEGSGGLGRVAGGPARASECDGGWSSLGPEVARLLSSPVDSKGGERRTWLAGRPVVAHFVCVCVPLRIELGPRNACAHDPSPARDGETVWAWSSTVDVDRSVEHTSELQ